jgi:RNA polymerase sigma-70 factor (ECF subfamily)
VVGLKGRRRTQEEFLAATLPSLDLVYNLARRLVTADEVEDLVQETYMKAFDAWSSDRKPRKVEPWMATICLNAGRSWLRRASRHREIPYVSLPEEASAQDVESSALGAVEARAVHEALWCLPEEQRIAIAFMDLAGFTAAETGRITGSPRGTVLARVHRGRKKLAHMLQGDREVLPLEP